MLQKKQTQQQQAPAVAGGSSGSQDQKSSSSAAPPGASRPSTQTEPQATVAGSRGGNSVWGASSGRSEGVHLSLDTLYFC